MVESVISPQLNRSPNDLCCTWPFQLQNNLRTDDVALKKISQENLDYLPPFVENMGLYWTLQPMIQHNNT